MSLGNRRFESCSRHMTDHMNDILLEQTKDLAALRDKAHGDYTAVKQQLEEVQREHADLVATNKGLAQRRDQLVGEINNLLKPGTLDQLRSQLQRCQYEYDKLNRKIESIRRYP
jgi:uncharacterized coiled-coil DUF342 family protein